MKRLWKRAVTVTLMLAMVFSLQMAPSHAAGTTPRIEEVSYEGNGKVEVEFDRAVQYKNLKITVTDTSKKKYKVRILEKDDDELEFQIVKYKKGKKYNFKIKSVRYKKYRVYKTVKGSVKIPKTTRKKA